MHQSRLSTFVIDCQTEDLEAAAAFWSRALRRGVKVPAAGDDRYRDLACSPSEPIVMVQRVPHEGRIHLDIESDDIDAEVARLEALGARPIERIRTWVVMQAPTGQRFCVVRPQRPRAAPPFPDMTPQHALLQGLSGHYTGRTSTWLDPPNPPDVADGELHAGPLAGGRWLRLEQLGSVAGTPHSGEMLLGYDGGAKQFELCWVDSFHTAGAMILSRGSPRDDGVIAVTGSYAAGEERWGWRTELFLRPNGDLESRAINITPAGQESPALETLWTRTKEPAAGPR
jgi:hypothetical protein